MRREMPSRPAAASNQRPRLLVSGACRPRCSSVATDARRGFVREARGDGVAPAGQRQRRGGHAPGLARRAVAAGQAQRAQAAQARDRRRRPRAATRRPRRCRRRRGRRRPSPARARGRARGARPARRRCARGGAAPLAAARGIPRPAAPRGACCRNRGAGRAPPAPARPAGCRSRCATASSSARQVGALSRSPTCCETKASSPRVTHTVFLNQPPRASTGGPALGQPDRPRRIAARAADELEAARGVAGHGAQHAVVAALHDVAVVQQEGVGDAGQPGQRLVVARDQRLAAGVGAGRHQGQRLRRLPASRCRPGARPLRGTAAPASGV